MALTETIVGLDIGDRMVTASLLQKRADGGLMLTHAGWMDYPAEASDRQIAAAIRSLWRQYHFSSFTVASCIRSQVACLKQFHVEGISGSELFAALRIEAEESLQIPTDQFELDWHLSKSSPRQPGGAATTHEGTLVAVPSTEINRHLEILQTAGLFPVAVDAGAMAVSNLFHVLKRSGKPGDAVCLVNLGKRFADVAVLYDTSYIYPRVVFSRSANWEENPSSLSAIILDVLKYYQYKLRQEPIEKVLLCGQVPENADFLPRLGTGFDVPVEVWNPIRELGLGFRASRLFSGANERHGPALAASLGVALGRDAS